MIRPGPAKIRPNRSPGGIVFQAYGTNPLRFLGEQRATAADTDEVAEAWYGSIVGQLGPDDAMVIVTFDGDTGERFVPPGFETGDQWTAGP